MVNTCAGKNAKYLKKVIISIVVLFLLLVSSFFPPPSSFFMSKQFNQAKWQQGSSLARGVMANDLINSNQLKGKKRSDVELLLGKPDYSSPNKILYVVDTGFRVMFSVWEYKLTIYFDDKGTFSSVTLTD